MSARADGRDAKRGVVSVATCLERDCQADAVWRLYVGQHPTRAFACSEHKHQLAPADKASRARWVLINSAGVPR